MTTNLTNSTNKVPNVPPLRFPEFTGEWEKIKVSDLLDFYSTNSLSWEQLEYDTTNLLNLHYGLIHIGLPTLIDLRTSKLPNIKKECLPTKYEICKEGDVAFADASEDTNEVAKVVELYNLNGKKVVCGLHTIQGRDNKGKTILGYKGYALSSQPFHFQIRRLAQGTKIYAVSVKNFTESYISIPSKEEQRKIVSLLSLLDSRIETQNKIIEDLKTLKSAISAKEFAGLKECFVERLGNLCSITTGKLDANAMIDDGQYMFFTCSRENYRTDTFIFEGEALLIAGNGEIGSVKYYNGKFNAYQRTYVLQNFLTNIKYLQFYIEYNLPKRVMKEKNVGAMPYIVLSTLADMPIQLPNLQTQKHIVQALQAIENKIDMESNLLVLLSTQKQYLLQQMFI